VAKCRAGADFAITNMFFYPEDYLRLRDRVAALGCDVPIIPGIMPVTSLRVIERALELGGCRVPTELWERLQAVAGDRAWVVSEAGTLTSVRLADGHLSGSRQLTRARCFCAPAVADGTLIAGDQDGYVHGIRLT